MSRNEIAAKVVVGGVSLLDLMATSHARVQSGEASAEEAETWTTFWLALLREQDQILAEMELLEQAPSIPAQADELAAGD